MVLVENLIFGIIMSWICIISLIGNLSLWIIIFRDKVLQSLSNILTLSLAGADILVSAVNMPVIVYTILAGDWMFSKEACTVLGYVTMLTFVASVVSLGAISINRYVMICYPAKFKSIYTKRNTGLMIAGVWLISALLSTPPLLGWASYDYLPGQSFCFCAWKTSISYTFFMVIVCFGGPCSVMTFCYVNILREVRKSRRRVQGGASSLSGRANASSKTQDRETTSTTIRNSDISEERKHNSLPPISSRESLHIERSDSFITEENVNIVERNNSTLSNSSYNQEYRSTVVQTYTDSTLSLSSQKQFKSRTTESNNNLTVVETSNRNNLIEEDSTVGSNLSIHDSNSQLERNASYKIANNATYDSFKNKPKKTGHRLSMPSPFKAIKGKSKEPRLSHIETLKRKKQEKRRQEELRLTTSFLIVICCFILCWLPFCVTMFWSVFSDIPVPRIPDIITLLLGCMNSCFNPIIYGAMNRNFRDGFKRLYCDCFRTCTRHCTKKETNTSTTIRSSTS